MVAAMAELPLPRELWGRDLRTAALALMLDRPGHWTVRRLRRARIELGFDDPGGKVLADALGHEVLKGRVIRVGWGTYGLRSVPARTRRRIQARLRSTVLYR